MSLRPLCPKCNGEVKWDGLVLTSLPPKYQHWCTDSACDGSVYLDYPRDTGGQHVYKITGQG